MQPSHLDSIGGPLLFVGTVLLLLLAGEAGFRAASRLGNPQQESQANVVTGALLGILGLLLAFSFGIVEGRFSARKALVVQEANAIGTAYLRASLIPEPHASRARKLLREYVDIKLAPHTWQNVPSALEKSERVHAALWDEARAAAQNNDQSVVVGLFVNAVNVLIDRHHERVTVVLYHRLPLAMLVTLYVVAAFCLALHGYSAGLVHVRVPLPAVGLVVSLAAVLLLVVELDRPTQSIFHISQDPLISARKAMSLG